jgi:tetratricopeptide (TPR) repeat protein
MTSFQRRIAYGAALIVLVLTSSSLAGEPDMMAAKALIDKGMLQREAGKPGSTKTFGQAKLLLDGVIASTGKDASDLAKAYELRARCRSLLGNNEQALSDLDKAIALSPDAGDLYYLRSFVHGTMGHDRASVADLQAAARKGYQKARDELTARRPQW